MFEIIPKYGPDSPNGEPDRAFTAASAKDLTHISLPAPTRSRYGPRGKELDGRYSERSNLDRNDAHSNRRRKRMYHKHESATRPGMVSVQNSTKRVQVSSEVDSIYKLESLMEKPNKKAGLPCPKIRFDTLSQDRSTGEQSLLLFALRTTSVLERSKLEAIGSSEIKRKAKVTESTREPASDYDPFEADNNHEITRSAGDALSQTEADVDDYDQRTDRNYPTVFNHFGIDGVRNNPGFLATTMEDSDVYAAYTIGSNDMENHNYPNLGYEAHHQEEQDKHHETLRRNHPGAHSSEACNLNLAPQTIENASSNTSDNAPRKSARNGEIQKHRCQFPYCGKVFSRLSQLKDHLRRHLGERPYICPHPYCNALFSRLDELRTHEHRHQGENPVAVPAHVPLVVHAELVPKGRGLTAATTTHKPARPLPCCNRCGASFASNLDLKIHTSQCRVRRTRAGTISHPVQLPRSGVFVSPGEIVKSAPEPNTKAVTNHLQMQSAKNFFTKGRVFRVQFFDPAQVDHVAVNYIYTNNRYLPGRKVVRRSKRPVGEQRTRSKRADVSFWR